MSRKKLPANLKVSPKNSYRVKNVKAAKQIASSYLKEIALEKAITFGLPEIDDRFDIWRVPLRAHRGGRIGEVVIDAYTSFIDPNKTTAKGLLEDRLLGRNDFFEHRESLYAPHLSTLRNTIAYGDSEELLKCLPNESIDLVYTSPPYYNARPEYAEYLSYEAYLLKMQRIIHECHRLLNEGRFFVINISPVLIRRASRRISDAMGIAASLYARIGGADIDH